jgi:2-polyprenyl-6-hydroxyphenyl methylase/3-demethylubiquinone-9 3-methyltransferase
MQGYYTQKLSAERLRKCYEIAPPRIKQYLEAEIEYILKKINPSDIVLELGCGYGRVLEKIRTKAKATIGIDTSFASIQLARQNLRDSPSSHLLAMNAVELGFRDRVFDVVICIQNGISAFKVDQHILIKEAMRVTRSGGRILFSSYSDRFWEDRLEWFQLQSDHGLLGEIDYQATGDGVIVCKDGFKATTIRPNDFVLLTADLNVEPFITEVDDSSIFYEIAIK